MSHNVSRITTEINNHGPWRITEYAKYRRVSRPTVYSWLSNGWLNSVKIGGCRFVLPEHDAAFIARFENDDDSRSAA